MNGCAMPALAYTSANHHKHTHPNLLLRAAIARFNARLLALADAAAPENVLEVGCGEGFLLKHLAERRPQWRLAGCDISASAVSYARRQLPASIRLDVADIHHLPMPSASYDLVICSEVLEHLEDVVPALAELRRVSRGHILITVPYEPLFRILTRLAVGLHWGRDPEHRQFWTAAAFRGLMRQQFARASLAYSLPYQLGLAPAR